MVKPSAPGGWGGYLLPQYFYVLIFLVAQGSQTGSLGEETMAENTSQELAPRDSFSGALEGVRSTLDGSSLEGRVALFQAVSSAQSIDDFVGKTFKIENIVQQEIELTDELTGELRPVTRTTFITDQGTFASTSDVVAKDVINVLGIIGKPATWSDKISFTIEHKKGKGARKFHTLTIA